MNDTCTKMKFCLSIKHANLSETFSYSVRAKGFTLLEAFMKNGDFCKLIHEDISHAFVPGITYRGLFYLEELKQRQKSRK